MDNYKKIELGMTEDAVKNIFGAADVIGDRKTLQNNALADNIASLTQKIPHSRYQEQTANITVLANANVLVISNYPSDPDEGKVVKTQIAKMETNGNFGGSGTIIVAYANSIEKNVKAQIAQMIRGGKWSGNGATIVAFANSNFPDVDSDSRFKFRDRSYDSKLVSETSRDSNIQSLTAGSKSGIYGFVKDGAGRAAGYKTVSDPFAKTKSVVYDLNTNINLYRLPSAELFTVVEKSFSLEEQEGRKKNRGGITALSSLYERYGGVGIARFYAPVVVDDNCVGVAGILAVNGKYEKVNTAFYGALQVISHRSNVNGGKSVLYQEGGFRFDLFETGEIVVRGRLIVWNGKDGSAAFAVADPNIIYRAYVCSSQVADDSMTNQPVRQKTANSPGTLTTPTMPVTAKVEQSKPKIAFRNLQEIRSALIKEYDNKFPLFVVGSVAEIKLRGGVESIKGTVEKITDSSVVISEQGKQEDILFKDIDETSRCRLDPGFRAKTIELVANQRAKTLLSPRTSGE